MTWWTLILMGETTLVTGASRGIGAAYSLLFADANANVMISDIIDLSETEKKISGGGS